MSSPMTRATVAAALVLTHTVIPAHATSPDDPTTLRDIGLTTAGQRIAAADIDSAAASGFLCDGADSVVRATLRQQHDGLRRGSAIAADALLRTRAACLRELAPTEHQLRTLHLGCFSLADAAALNHRAPGQPTVSRETLVILLDTCRQAAPGTPM